MHADTYSYIDTCSYMDICIRSMHFYSCFSLIDIALFFGRTNC